MKPGYRVVSLLLVAGLTGFNAWASGAEGAWDEFVSRSATDVDLNRYDKGELGVILSSYPRVYLYPAWRAIVLGADGLRTQPANPGGLRDAVGSYVGGWVDAKHPYTQWQRESDKLLQRQTRPGPPAFRTVLRGSSQYLNCPSPAFVFAIQNLEMLTKRRDATPERLRDWITAQDSVFDFCDYDPQAKPYGAQAARPAPQIPKPLATTEPRYWRQIRDYQIATAHFYNESYAESRQGFDLIAATRDHPMQRWGAYLALRSDIRSITMETNGDWETRHQASQQAQTQRNPIVQLNVRAQRILADPSLKALHEATRASIRTAQYRLAPLDRLYELSEQLDDVTQDPYRQSALGDWRRLANDLFEGNGSHRKAEVDPDLRSRFSYFNWMRSLQDCGLAPDPKATCAAATDNALKRWQSSAPDKSARPGEHRAWMVAALMLSDKLSPQLEQAALGVAPTAPEYLTVRYHLARLYRIAGLPAKARDISDAALNGPQLAQAQSNSAIFLFQQERFVSARSLDDAALFLVRKSLWTLDRDTGETVLTKDSPQSIRLAADGLMWLNTRLGVADLLALAKNQNLPASTRSALITTSWMRSDFLNQTKLANEAASIAQSLPGLRDTADAYLKASSLQDRRHLLVLTSLRQGISPVIMASGPDYTKPPAAITPDFEENTVANMWCTISTPSAAAANPWNVEAEKIPPSPDLSTNAKVRDREISDLVKIGTATGFVGAHVLNRAKTHPSDPDLPWLLYVVVQSTRGGCVDAGNSKLSRAAYNVLHTRFKNSPWAQKTPYWY